MLQNGTLTKCRVDNEEYRKFGGVKWYAFYGGKLLSLRN